MSILPWEKPEIPALALPWATPSRPELTKDPVTGLWPGQAHPMDIPDFLKAKNK